MPKKVLVIEDDRPISKALELKLKHSGFDVKTIFDGESAIEILKKEKFDIILMDLVMPKIDGFGVLKDMQEKGNKTPVFVLTNLSQENDIDKVKKLGALEYFIKSDAPISKIIERVKKFLQ